MRTIWRPPPAAPPGPSAAGDGTVLLHRSQDEHQVDVRGFHHVAIVGCEGVDGIAVADLAAHGNPEYSLAEGNDYPAHEQTYVNFLALVKWGIIVIVLILIGMAYFLV